MKLPLLLKSVLLVSILIWQQAQASGSKAPNRNPLVAAKPGTYKLHPASNYREQVMIFKVLPQYRELCSNNQISISGVQNAMAVLGGGTFKKMFPNHQPPARMKDEKGHQLIDLSLIYEYRYSNKVGMEEACNLMLRSGVVQYAEPWYIYAPTFTPNDPSLAQQYHISRIDAIRAWDITQGDTSVVIGIVDSGIDIDHPDMVGNMAYNNADPVDGVDNDNDGYVDNNRGWDFAGADFNNIRGDNNPGCNGSNTSHGSHVSGISSAVTNNGVGTSGVAFKCRFMGLKCSADNDTRAGGQGFIIGGYQGITYAADHGASIINCSWGGGGFASSFEQDVIDYATFNKGALVVAAAGNANVEDDFYPAYLENVLSVASTTRTDTKSGFSNYSYKVGIAAPGSAIFAAMWNNTYQNNSGTSMASPVVAGCAALVKSRFPQLGPLAIAAALRSTADNIYTIAANRTFAGKLGSGRVNVFKAVQAAGPSLKLDTSEITDRTDDIFVSGDTIFFTGRYKNYLFTSSSQLRVRLISLTPATVSVLVDSVNLGRLGQDQSVTQSIPFKMVVRNSTVTDQSVVFRLDYKDSAGYLQSEYFSLMVNQTFINVRKNNIKTTIASNGRIGYSGDQATQGLGFLYRDIPTLFEMGVLAATGADSVGDCIRDDAQGYRKTFTSVQNVREVRLPANGDYNVINTFIAPATQAQPNIRVKQTTYVWTTPGDSNYIIVGYVVSNPSSNPIRNLHYGIFSDYDISANGANDIVRWEPSVNLGYVRNTNAGGHLAGIGLLTNYNRNFMPITNDGTNGSAFQIYDGFTLAEKYRSLSSGVNASNTVGAAAGQDVSLVAGYGPFTLAPNDSVTLLFALTAGPDLQTITTAVGNAGGKLPNVTSLNGSQFAADVKLIPNPAQRWVRFEGLLGDKQINATVNDALGRQVAKLQINPLDPVVELPELQTGVYFVNLGGKTLRLAIR